jgi:hypothetical protein
MRGPCMRRECVLPRMAHSKYCSQRCGVLNARAVWRVSKRGGKGPWDSDSQSLSLSLSLSVCLSLSLYVCVCVFVTDFTDCAEVRNRKDQASSWSLSRSANEVWRRERMRGFSLSFLTVGQSLATPIGAITKN